MPILEILMLAKILAEAIARSTKPTWDDQLVKLFDNLTNSIKNYEEINGAIISDETINKYIDFKKMTPE